MSESAAEGAVAGRLEVIVEAALRGFAADLKRKVEEASKNVKAKIGVEVDSEGLRETLQAKVDEAAAGVTARIGVDFDAGLLKEKVKAAATAAATDVNIGVDTKGIVPEVAAAVEVAQATSGEVDVPVKASAGTLLLSTLKEKIKTQLAMLRNPVTVPVKADSKGLQRDTSKLGGLLKGGLVLGIVSLIQPLLGSISQLVSGLTAIVAAGAPAVNTIAAFPISIGAFIQAMIAGKVATQGFGSALQLLAKQQKGPLSPEEAKQLKQALGELSPSAGLFAKEIVGLRGAWISMRKKVQEPLFKPLAKEIKPLAHDLLPVLEKGLSGTTTVFGRWVTSASAFLRSPAVKGDLGKVFKSNNRLIAAFGSGLGDVGAGMLDFAVAARPFTKRIGDVAKGFGDWFRAKSAAGRDSGSTEKFLDRAGDRLSLIWKLTKNVAGGFKGIFKAADGTGLGLLTDFDDFLAKWNTWANGPDGQKRMQEFFKNTEPGFREIVGLVHDIGIGFLKMGEDPAIVKLLEKIRNDIGPALSRFLTEISHNVAPATVEAIAAILNTMAELAPVTKGVAEAFKVVFDAIGLLAQGLQKLGPLGDAVLNIAGFVVGYRLLTKLPLLGPLISSIGNLVLTTTGLRGAGGELSLFARSMGLLRLGAGAAVVFATNKLTGMIDTTSETGKGFKAMATAAGYATAGFLVAGPVGAAIGAGIGALSNLSDASDKARAAFREQIKTLGDYGAALDASDGKITSTIRKQAGVQLAKTQPNAISAANAIGLPIRDVIGTMLGLEGATKRVKAAMDAAKASNVLFTNDLGTQQDVYSTLNSTLFTNIKGHEGLARSFAAQRKAALAAADGARTWKEALKGVAPAAQKALSSVIDRNVLKGKVFDGKQLLGLQQKFNLPDKQVRIIAKAVGVPAALKQYHDLKKAAKEASDASNPKKGVDAANKTTAANKTAAQSFKGLKKSAKEAIANITSILGGGGAKSSGSKPAGAFLSVWKDAFAGVPKAARKNKGPTRAASAELAAMAQAPIKGLPGKFVTYGTNLSQGLAAGMNSALSLITAAADAMAAEADRAVRAKAEIRSPSKVMKRLGRFISQGFAQGILGGVEQVQHATDELFKRLRATGHKGLAKEIRKKFADDFDQLEKYAKQRQVLARKLAAAQAKLDELTSKKSSLIDTVKSSGEDLSSVSSIASSNGGFLSPGFLVGELQRRLAKAKEFAADLLTLRKKGFGEATIRQIASEGIEGGLALARQLLSSTPDQVAQVNSLQNQITSVATSTANTTANALYNAGIQAAQGLVKGLASQQKELEKVAKKLAHTIVSEIKKELKIKSPSRVTQALGAFTTLGLTKGLRSKRDGLLKEARHMSNLLTAELSSTGPSLSYGGRRTYEQTAAARSATGPTPLVPVPAGRGALVENLSLTAGTPADARAVLDEAMHALRKIESGGVHGDRVA